MPLNQHALSNALRTTKIGLRGQQIILFLFVSLMPLFAVSLTIKVLGENALKGSVGDSLVLLAQEKLHRADLAISEKMSNIYGELPNLTEAVARSNSANGKQVVLMAVWARLEDSVRLLEAYAGYGSEVTITNAAGYVLRSNEPGLDYKAKRRIPHRLNDEDWWQSAYNNGIGYPLVADVTYDEARDVHVLRMALPIEKEKRGRRHPENRVVATGTHASGRIATRHRRDIHLFDNWLRHDYRRIAGERLCTRRL